MIEEVGNIWDYHKEGNWVCVTTNGCKRKSGKAIMGKGIAYTAQLKYPLLPFKVGQHLVKNGNVVGVFSEEHIFTFPTKSYWKEDSSITLVLTSAFSLVKIVGEMKLDHVYLPRPGCGNGKLKWPEVKELLKPIFDDRFIIVDWVRD